MYVCANALFRSAFYRSMSGGIAANGVERKAPFLFKRTEMTGLFHVAYERAGSVWFSRMRLDWRGALAAIHSISTPFAEIDCRKRNGGGNV